MLIDFSKGREPACSRLLEMIEAGDDLGVCPINIAEFYAGVPREQRALWDEFLSSLCYWEIGLESARQAGCFRYDFARKGIVISTADSLVASVAIEWNAFSSPLAHDVDATPSRGYHSQSEQLSRNNQ